MQDSGVSFYLVCRYSSNRIILLGKIFGIEANYYIAEVEFPEGEGEGEDEDEEEAPAQEQV